VAPGRVADPDAGIEEPLAIGAVMRGRGVGQVMASNHPGYQVGDYVQGKLGWQEYSVSDGSPYYVVYKIRQRLSPQSTAIGVLGITGFTSYFGLVDIGQAKKGETVLVSGAAGGVGSNVSWIARNLGCREVGIAGATAKRWMLTEKLGYDAAINYRSSAPGELPSLSGLPTSPTACGTGPSSASRERGWRASSSTTPGRAFPAR